jgi:molybdate transport system substrate-binding protein
MVMALFISSTHYLWAGQLKIAVASNFLIPAQKIQNEFEIQYNKKIVLLAASSGKHYAQIANGAPIDILLAADTQYTEKLIQQGKALAETHITYAIGKIVLAFKKEFSRNIFKDYRQLCEKGEFFLPDNFAKLQYRFLAFAHPDLAPYGRAATEVMERLKIPLIGNPKLIKGENIMQTQQFLNSGNVDLAFLALSQVVGGDGMFLSVPTKLYAPIRQNLVVIKDSPETKTALQFFDFIKTEKIKKIIQQYGYETP